MIGDIRIMPYRYPYSFSDSTQYTEIERKIKDYIRVKLPIEMPKVDMFNMGGEKNEFGAGKENHRLVILCNHTHTHASDPIQLEEPVTLYGTLTQHRKLLSPLADISISHLIISPEGYAVAEWFEESYELNILFDIFGEGHEDDDIAEEQVQTNNRMIFGCILNDFYEAIFKPKLTANSWVHTNDQDALVGRIKEQFVDVFSKRISDQRSRISNSEETINSLKSELKRVYDDLLFRRRSLQMMESNSEDMHKTIIKDLNAIIKDKRIRDVHIKDDKFIIFTEHLDIHDDKGNTYMGGEYEISIAMETATVRIKGNNTRHGYWSETDPHPHVSGREGRPCLGTASDSIAQLCSQMELHALITVVLDFLESAYSADVAGAHVRKWDLIDEKTGEIIVVAEEMFEEFEEEEHDPDCAECYECGEEYHHEDLEPVRESIDSDGVLGRTFFICNGCRDNIAVYFPEHEAYVIQP